ncbi:hypothetical protein BGZ95_004849, partial [Linnemannia exigua]
LTPPNRHSSPSAPPTTAYPALLKDIVIFKEGTCQEDITKAENDIIDQGGNITNRYNTALLGFAASIPESSIQALNIHPSVDYIEPDGVVTTQ